MLLRKMHAHMLKTRTDVLSRVNIIKLPHFVGKCWYQAYKYSTVLLAQLEHMLLRKMHAHMFKARTDVLSRVNIIKLPHFVGKCW